MTYKYIRVRNDVYDKCNDKEMKKLRNGKELKQLFRPLHWYLLLSTPLAIIMLGVIFFTSKKLWLELIPSLIIFVNSILAEYRFDRALDKNAREKELELLNENYDNYIRRINEVLKSHGINDKEKRSLLRNECVEYLDNHNKRFKSFSSGVFAQLIGVPIGALISALIYKNDNAIVSQIIGIIIIGLGVIAIVKFIKWITYYTEGYLKDERLLDVLDELEYSVNDNELVEKVVLWQDR